MNHLSQEQFHQIMEIAKLKKALQEITDLND